MDAARGGAVLDAYLPAEGEPAEFLTFNPGADGVLAWTLTGVARPGRVGTTFFHLVQPTCVRSRARPIAYCHELGSVTSYDLNSGDVLSEIAVGGATWPFDCSSEGRCAWLTTDGKRASSFWRSLEFLHHPGRCNCPPRAQLT